LTGAYAISVISADAPDTIVTARNGPPAVIGVGEGESFVASDVPGILHHTRMMYFLADGDVAILTPQGVKFTNLEGDPVERKVEKILWDPIQAEKGGYKHFMLKEIFEQPRAVRDTTLGRISLETGEVFLGEMKITDDHFRAATQMNIAACGTSWHSALAGKYMIERLARIPVEVDYASEYRYRDPIADPHALGMLITQSGETADTLAAQREMIAKGSMTIAICNVVGSMVAREAHGTIYTHAGPGDRRGLDQGLHRAVDGAVPLCPAPGAEAGDDCGRRKRALVDALSRIPGKIEEVLRQRDGDVPATGQGVCLRVELSLFLGRGIHFPIALEGALKLKEISYIHAEGYPAGEMKHGPNALIDESLAGGGAGNQRCESVRSRCCGMRRRSRTSRK
jgi:glucosamine--fructose-6-phosphate aminotransferase (isomerizing)